MPKTIVLYDGGCPFCLTQMRMLRSLDWRHQLTLQPLDDPKARQLIPELQRAELSGAMHCVAPDGSIYRGARAIRCLGLRVPLLVPLGVLLWIPGVLFFAEKVYRWIARHRLALGRILGCRDACSIPPATVREG